LNSSNGQPPINNKAQSAGVTKMSAFFKPMEEQDLNYDGFYDGQNKTIPDNYETTCLVTDGFNGIEEGKAQQVLFLNLTITEPGEFCSQKYRYNAKIYDMDANKRDLAMRNLGVVDAQAGFPMTNGQMEPTTDNIQDYWAGSAEIRVKFGLMVQTEDKDGNKLLDENGVETVRYMNFVRGFGYLREKMRKPIYPGQQQAAQQAPQQQSGPAYANQPDPDIDF
jgi:hypothetical protein